MGNPEKNYSQFKTRIMRRIFIKKGLSFCMTAALLWSIMPLTHGLHFLTCNHTHHCHNIHDSEHDHYGHSRCTNQGDASGHRETLQILPWDYQDSVGHIHDSSTCPLCQSFSQLMKGHGFSPQTGFPSLQIIQLGYIGDSHSFPYRPAHFNINPRAPPISRSNFI